MIIESLNIISLAQDKCQQKCLT